MIFADAWRRFVDHWPKLLLAGLFATLVHLILGAVCVAVFVPFLASAGLHLGAVSFGLDGATFWSGALMMAAFSKLLAGLLVVVLLALLVAPIVQGGLLHTVLQAYRGEPAGPADFWAAGLANWRRLFFYHLMLIPAWVVLMLITLVPVLGVLFGLIVFGPVSISLAYYGPYALMAEDLSPGAAVTRAFRIVTERPVDLFITWWLGVGAMLVVGLVVGILSVVPGLGKLLNFLLEIALVPFFLLYLAIRYETNIAGAFTPPGGTSSFHR